ncbi:hypothetical protein [Streptomyces glomeratus]|uniref:CR-type domain-containing protein n=1 Tax=Streptomyces glomeratus TaxID=284452 RepID=A0ABP6LSC8_9ACTN|nr:hypothetical protein [Streptomyces glomeratus]MCF1511850.1 hypothetical protein [Streptomyces glomeratus]
MAKEPSTEEILQAVELHVARHGITARLSSPGTADLSRQPLLDCRIVRSIEKREEGRRRVPGRPADVAGRETYTDLATHPLDPPSDPSTARKVELVLEGSLGEAPCDGCDGGRTDCERCAGRGRLECEPFVECEGCEGGIDACWECEGSGRPRPRGRRTDPRPADVRQRVRCVRCRRPDAACPACLGRGRTKCADCKGTGSVQCPGCKGARRLRHAECAGTGVFTTWTGAVISHTPEVRRVEQSAPLHLRQPTDGAGQWRRTVLTTATEKLPDDLDPRHRELILPHLALADGEVGRRVTVRRLPLARVTAHADPDRVYFAFPSHTGIKVVERPSRQRVVRFTAVASTTLAVAVLVLVLVLVVLG